jgi:nucleolar pre-ribosomal-associated protein 1
LVGELLETVKLSGLEYPVASILTEFTAAALDVLKQPAHPTYGKINKFLQKGPSWELSKFIGYWIESLLLREPDDPSSHNAERSWFLNILIRGLQDMKVFLSRSLRQ